MRDENLELNKYRIRGGPYATRDSDNMRGMFVIKYKANLLRILSSGDWKQVEKDEGVIPGQIWEHVSVSLKNRCPNWEEMCLVKTLFWDDEETVVQFHPKKSEYINVHAYCLHLWKKKGYTHEIPPGIYVGPSAEGVD
jgi:hypothetical protein